MGRLARWFGLALLASVLGAAPVEAATLVSYEVLPSAQVVLPGVEQADYAARSEVTAAALKDLVPAIVAAVGVPGAVVETQLTPGGYLLKTNASLQSRVDGEAATAERLAAAFGYVFRQESVLVTDLDAKSGGTGFVVVRFPAGTLAPTMAQAFFAHAASVNEGLGGGYTAFGDDQFFLNLRGDDGQPYSELEDDVFRDGLARAAASFQPPGPVIAASGSTEARLVGNDWVAAPDGQEYAARLGSPGSAVVATLDDLRAAHTKLVTGWAQQHGWR